MKPLEIETWNMLKVKQKWDVMVTLRGPDVKNPWLKLITTAVIRARMRRVMGELEMRVGGMIGYDATAIILPEIGMMEAYRLTYLAGSTFDFEHFITHIREATEILDIPIIRVPVECYMAILQARRAKTHDTALMLLTHLKEEPQMMEYIANYAGISLSDDEEDNEDED